MSKIVLFLFFISSMSFSQTIDHVAFDYDAAGNQVRRYVIDINPGRSSNQNVKNIEQLTDADLLKTDIYNDVKYYPNPVLEELYVKWDTKNYFVVSIELYSITGQLMKNYSVEKNSDNQTIGFSSYPAGLYNVVLNYSTGEKRTLKIVKN